MQLELSAAEAAVVADVLDTALGQLREEVYKSETAEYKDRLREREAVLTSVVQRLGARATTTSA